MRILLHKKFIKRYKKAPAQIQDRFDDRLRLFERDPLNALLNMHPLTGDRDGEWSINITGDWRAVYISISDGSVMFIDLGTHAELYGK